jgi:hypothetical protein
MCNFYISFDAEQEYTAWYKAIADVEYFLDSLGFHPIPIKFCRENLSSCLQTYLGVKEKSDETGIILVQYPRIATEGLDLNRLINLIKSCHKNYRLVALVHDLDSIRFGNFYNTNYREVYIYSELFNDF